MSESVSPPIGNFEPGDIVASRSGEIFKQEGEFAQPIAIVSCILRMLKEVSIILGSGEEFSRLTLTFEGLEYVVGARRGAESEASDEICIRRRPLDWHMTTQKS